MIPAYRPPEWMEQAACATVGNWHAFHSDHADDIEYAKNICAGCPVKNECLIFALQWRDGYGIYGGLTPTERGINRGHLVPREENHGDYNYAQSARCKCEECKAVKAQRMRESRAAKREAVA